MKSASLQRMLGFLKFSRSALPATTGIVPFYKRDVSELWIMLGLGLFTLTVYILTLTPGVDPGTPAVATAGILGLLPGLSVTHPLYLLIARGVAALPFSYTVVRLNLLSAVCSSLAVVYLFRITKRIIFEFIRESPSFRMVPCDDETPGDGAATANGLYKPDGDGMEHLIATLGSVVTALAFAFSAPFWIASVSLHVQPFEILLLLVTLDLLACYNFTGKTKACVLFFFLLGIGVVESVACVVLAPLGLLVVIYASIRYEQIGHSFLLLMLLVFLSGLALNLGLLLLLSSGGHVISTDLIIRSLSSLTHDHVEALRGGLPMTGGLFVIFQTTLPALLALISIRIFNTLQSETTMWKWGITNVLFTGFSIACLMNLPCTAWHLAREGSHLPVFPSLAIALAVGIYFVYWLLMATVPTYNTEFEMGPPSPWIRLLSYGMSGMLALMTVCLLYTNLNDANGRKSAFADCIVDEMLLQVGSARCLMTDDIIDMNLLIRAHLSAKKISVFSCRLAPGSAKKTENARIVMQGDTATQNQSTEAFVERWLLANPREYAQVAVVGNPALWKRAGFTPVSTGLLYVGLPENGAFDSASALAQHRALWQRIGPLLADDQTLRPELRRVQTRLRVHTSRMANDLGVFLENRGSVQEADSAYCEALRIDDMNLCASLNRYALHLRNKMLGLTPEIAQQVKTYAAKPGFIDAFDGTVSRYGVLAPQQADILLPAVLANCVRNSKPVDSLIRLWEKWLEASYAAPITCTESIALSESSPDTALPDPKLAQAVAMHVNGDSVKAERHLRLIVKNRPALLSAWSLLAEILINRGELKEVQAVVLPTMRKAAGITNGINIMVEMTQGCLFTRTDPPDTAEARACFLRAMEMNPKLAAAHEQLLRADMLLGRSAYLEADALAILKYVPNHVLANSILGSLQLAQERFAESESHLRKSIKSQATAGALNDLAELCRLQGKHVEAEQQVRLAIRLRPEFYQAWDTLVCILIEKGRLDEAEDSARCALLLGPKDPRLYLTLTRLRIAQGRLQEASRTLDFSKPLFGKNESPLYKDYAGLRHMLASRTSSSLDNR
ncbi:MAG: DUF2723 domain-containing protein [Kiritimatiellae bacterium]|jgi:Flp pilus assembly protein TadD/NADH:ubiquinone oxidoreductase subunit K|nr:DUF2723 domain-containing protein [Kiritimatiellia bacterium]